MKKSMAFRATFEDVLICQEKLRKWLDRLVEEDRPLKPEERGPFMQLVGRAMLGQGSRIPIRKNDRDGSPVSFTWHSDEISNDITLETADDMIRYLAYWTGGMDKHAGMGGKGGAVSISQVWKEARQLALKAFSLALAQAASMSIEHVPYEPSKSERF